MWMNVSVHSLKRITYFETTSTCFCVEVFPSYDRDPNETKLNKIVFSSSSSRNSSSSTYMLYLIVTCVYTLYQQQNV